MSATQVHPVSRGECRILMLGTAVLAAAAAGVLALGTQDARMLRLGLLAALWAALLGAFAAAHLRRAARSSADHAEVLRTTYQFELEREVSARREHTLRIERELREQAERSQRSEIGELRAELAAMRANLELLTGAPMVERVMVRAEATRMYPLPAQTRDSHDNHAVTAAIPATRGRPATSASTPSWDSSDTGVVHDEQAPGRQWSRPDAQVGRPPAPPAPYAHRPVSSEQRTVDDLLAAHGALPTPRRRRSRQPR